MIDWTTILEVAGIVFYLSISTKITAIIYDRFDPDMHRVVPGAFWVLCVLFNILAQGVLVVLYVITSSIATSLIAWGYLNTFLMFLIGLPAIIVPFIGFKKPLLFVTTAIPHYLERFRKEKVQYKAQLEEKYPIKRSIYEVIND